MRRDNNSLIGAHMCSEVSEGIEKFFFLDLLMYNVVGECEKKGSKVIEGEKEKFQQTE